MSFKETEELRFGFGQNWAEFIEKNFNESIVESSKQHLREFVRKDSLQGLSFLDIGCGSGLHSLAAHKLQADAIVSFDYDQQSVATTRKLREFAGSPDNWSVHQGSVLERHHMEQFPKFDVVYSWGVLHHTGDMWTAVRNAAIPMKPDGLFYIALYSSDNYVDPPPEYWLKVKRAYNLAGPLKRRRMEWQYALRFLIIPELLSGRNPLAVIRKYGKRGMSYWTDVKDWLGGYPMDFASLQETQSFAANELGLDLVNVLTGEGCTEYLFCNLQHNQQWRSINERRRLIPLDRPFTQSSGSAFVAHIPQYEAKSDSGEEPRRSRLMVWEDNRMLGLAHSLHDHISRFGGGRFSHYGPNLYFSASDNTDPNNNGRTYTYCEEF